MNVGELIEILSHYPADTPVQITSTDGPDYGWISVGGEPHGGLLYGGDQITNEKVLP